MTRAFGEGLLSADVHLRALRELAAERTDLEKQITPPADGKAAPATKLRSGLETARSVWDVHILLGLTEQRLLVQAVFERLEVDCAGIVRYSLKQSSSATWKPAA